MSTAPPSEGGARWAERRRRAEELQQERPHALQMLQVYIDVLQLQEPLYHETRSDDRYRTATLRENHTSPLLDLGHLPVHDLVPQFRRYVADAGAVAGTTEVLAGVAERLAPAGNDLLADLLRHVAARAGLDTLTAALHCDAPQLEFFARGFLEPITQGVVEGAGRGDPDRRERSCPLCGWPPQVSVVRDEPDALGQRVLVCSMCATWWPYLRITCANCGEDDPGQLAYHEVDAAPHLRIETCQTCKAYLKSVDLRKAGLAVPVVEDLATVELDLWCGEQGLVKVQRNLLGM